MAALLVVTRLKDLPYVPFSVYDWIQACQLPLEDIFGTDIGKKVKPLYLPGTVFIVVSLLAFFLHRMDFASYKTAWKKSTVMMYGQLFGNILRIRERWSGIHHRILSAISMC